MVQFRAPPIIFTPGSLSGAFATRIKHLWAARAATVAPLLWTTPLDFVAGRLMFHFGQRHHPAGRP